MTDRVSVQAENFDVAAEIAALKQAGGHVGAIVTFSGVVRADDGLTSLTLEHYPGMAEREIERHIREARSRWPLLGVTVIHRIGRLKPGDEIVLVAIGSAHRAAALAAAEFLMDHLKLKAPFWKREERDGNTIWVKPRASDEDSLRRWR